jgi:CRISPR-associated exonuclease Cas4
MDEPILLSALNQYAYCPRRCYLIHAEGEFENNIHTQRGSAEHERVGSARPSGRARIETHC